MEGYEIDNLSLTELKYYSLFVLNMIYDDHVMNKLNDVDSNATVCPCCCVDDFTHVEGCKILQIYNNEIINNDIYPNRSK